MRFLTRPEVRRRFEGKSVAIVGSGPGALDNDPGFIDSHRVVVRVNNYKITPATGSVTDVFYSFFGTSVRKEVKDLRREGVALCIAKCPNAHAIQSEWHRVNNKMPGVDFRYIYELRRGWWFCDTYVPTVEEFMVGFELLGRHIPTTGFAAILDILSFEPRSVYLTGFDFFESGKHNLDQPWRTKNTDDPICHVPQREKLWLIENISRFPIEVDAALGQCLELETE